MGYIRDLSIQFLLGCTLTNWIKLLWQNRDKPIYWKSLPKFIYITVVIILLTPVRLIEKLLFDIKVKNTRIEKDPVLFSDTGAAEQLIWSICCLRMNSLP